MLSDSPNDMSFPPEQTSPTLSASAGHGLTLKQASTEALKQEYDAYVCAHPAATPYQMSAWLDAVNSSYGIKGEIMLAEKEGRVVAVLSRAVMPKPFGQHNYCSLPYCDVGGVLADNELLADQLWSACMTASQSESIHARRESAIAPLASEALKDAEESTASIKARLLLPLKEDSEAMLASFKSKLRSQIKKSSKNGVVCEVSSDIDGFYGVMQKNMHRLGSPCHSKRWFEQVLECYGDNARLYIAKVDEQIVGGSITLRCGNKVAVPWASTLAEFNRLSPNMLLYWTMLSTAIADGADNFDFGRSTIGEGTYRFKRQWGAEVFPLKWRDYKDEVLLPASSEKRGRMGEAIVAIWTKLPSGVVNRLGPLVRPYISL